MLNRFSLLTVHRIDRVIIYTAEVTTTIQQRNLG